MGGRVVEVTTLAASGPGSLAEALAAQGPRTIVFQVGGVIDLAGGRLSLRSPHATIAGETAPPPGITIIRGGFGISSHDVIVRHIRVRVGEAGRAKRSGWEVDGVATNTAHDVIVDHCSISWSTDENLSASGPRFDGANVDEWRKNTSHRITFSHCLIAEALHDSTHGKGPHSMGSLIHDNASDVLIYGNLYLSNNARNPLFKGGSRGAIVNNFVHNPGGGGPRFGLQAVEWEGRPWERGALVIVGNVVRQGPSSGERISFAAFRGPCDACLKDNLLLDRAGQPLPTAPRFVNQAGEESAEPAPGEFRALPEPPFWPTGLEARPAGEVVPWLLADVGARPWDRDAVDRRLVEEARTGGGKIIHSESEVGGYAVLTAPTH
ncbi:MAG: pectate lyase [Planctomycetes bacterium]|nr:pectate lyase [Planctomycetota bacterium]